MTDVHRHSVASTSPTSTTTLDQEEARNPGQAFTQTPPPVPSHAAQAEPTLLEAPPLIHRTEVMPPLPFLCSGHVSTKAERQYVSF